MKKKLIALGLGLGLIAGGVSGVVLGAPSLSAAQEDTTTTAPDMGWREPGYYVQEALQPLVEAGTITQAQADAVVEALLAAKPDRPRHPGARLGLAAETIGITTEELVTALREGSSIAEVAAANNVEAQTVIDAMVAQLQSKLNEAVAAGKITQERADAIAADAPARITELVNGTRPFGRGHHGPGLRTAAPEGADTSEGASETGLAF